jgi:membrane-bound lytic murein transglycosylase D
MPREWQHHNGEDYDDLFDRMRAGFAFEEVQEPAIDTQLAWFEHNPEYLERVFQRGQRYMYHIITEVEARGMPLEFALLPVVESAYEPFAYSTSRAAGLWQFIPGTGARFGLKQNWWYDGRRDVVESTRAALDYLQALHDQFNGWRSPPTTSARTPYSANWTSTARMASPPIFGICDCPPRRAPTCRSCSR